MPCPPSLPPRSSIHRPHLPFSTGIQKYKNKPDRHLSTSVGPILKIKTGRKRQNARFRPSPAGNPGLSPWVPAVFFTVFGHSAENPPFSLLFTGGAVAPPGHLSRFRSQVPGGRKRSKTPFARSVRLNPGIPGKAIGFCGPPDPGPAQGVSKS